MLLTGETGTGKEIVARALHGASGRRGVFVPVNCGGLPEGLVESELFGHGKGAFTGAGEAVPGLIEEADGGTLFLDEVGDLPLQQQARLLRFLDDGTVRRVGETRVRAVAVRVIAATNRDLQDDMASGRFRKDLYFRLAAVSCRLPPLRDRPEDIEGLARYWLSRFTLGDVAATVSREGLEALRAYHWPGNVRELHHVLAVAWSMRVRPVLTPREIGMALGHAAHPLTDADTADEKRRMAEAALLAHRWNVKKAAKSLGKSRTTFYRWLGRGGKGG